jgi:hypothetical protein
MAQSDKRTRPCFGGPYDGQWRPENFPPLGYRSYKVRGRMIWLWRSMKVELIDFDTMSKAARARKKEYEDIEPSPGEHLEPH